MRKKFRDDLHDEELNFLMDLYDVQSLKICLRANLNVLQKLKGIIMVFSFLSVSGKNNGNSGQEFDLKKQLKCKKHI